MPTKHSALYSMLTVVSVIALSLSFQNCAQTTFSEAPPEEISLSQSVAVSCDSRAEGDVWEALNGTLEIASTCGAPQVLQKFSNYECREGLAIETGYRAGQVISEGGVCPGTSPAPVAPRSCNGLAHGSARWESAGTEQVQALLCANGTRLYDVYARERELLCTDGTLSPTGRTRRGALVSSAGSCPVVQPVACPGGFSEGQLKSVTEGTSIESRACPAGQTGAITDTYTKLNQYRCQSGSFVYVGSTKGSLVQSQSSCMQPARPAHCTDFYLQEMCDIYHYLFQRWPEQGGATFWVNGFTAEGLPKACWTRRVAAGTQGSDCQSHLMIHGFYPNSPNCPASPRGDAYQARPTAQCP